MSERFRTLPELRMSRRTLLTATAGAVVAGCTSQSPHRAAAADPDAAALAAARDGERQLLASYDASHPARAVHLAHLQALGADPAAAPSPAPATAASARAAERATVGELQAAAGAAHRGVLAATLASIAASHAVLGRSATG